jgi:hypothetical protein
MMVMTSKNSPPPASTEVLSKARRRSYTTAYKLDLLRRADECEEPGEIGKLLREEGLYSSHLAVWRKARANGELSAKAPTKRGPKAREHDARDREIDELKRQVAKLQARAERAEQLVELQKKVAELLGRPLDENESKGGKR